MSTTTARQVTGITFKHEGTADGRLGKEAFGRVHLVEETKERAAKQNAGIDPDAQVQMIPLNWADSGENGCVEVWLTLSEAQALATFLGLELGDA